MIRAALPNFAAVLTEVILTLGILLEVLISVFSKENAQRNTFYGALVILVCAFAALLFQFSSPGVTFGGQYTNDLFTLTSKCFVLGLAIIAFYMVMPISNLEDLNQSELPILMLTALLGMLIMISANDLLVLFLGIELQSLSVYTLVCLRRHNIHSSEAALKYFILGALSTGFLLYGISYIYGLSGTLSFDALHRFFRSHNFTGVEAYAPYIGIVFLLGGLCFKIAAAPFHFWVPDVYQGAPTSIVAFMATVAKFAGFVVILQVLGYPLIGAHGMWSAVISVIAVVSMFWGAISALMQTNVKRLLAYSSIGQVGFGLIGLVLGNEHGSQSAFAYMAFYSLMLLGLFGILLQAKRRGIKIETIKDLSTLRQYFPHSALGLAVILLSMAGIPPFPGFLTKLYILKNAIAFSYYAISLLGVVYSVLAAAYYLILLKAMFFDEANHPPITLKPKAYVITLAVGLILTLMVYVLLCPSTFFDLAMNVTSTLFFQR